MDYGINQFKNKHTGERAFIVGNGPSLSKTPLENLKDEYTFATKKIYKIFSETSWRPTYYLQPTYLDSGYGWLNEVEKFDTICFVNKESSKHIERGEDVFDMEIIMHPDPREDCFGDPSPPSNVEEYWSDEFHEYIYWYNSSVYPLYQLANYMGFDKIYLVGIDLGFDINLKLLDSGEDPYYFLRHKGIYPKSEYSIKVFNEFIRSADNTIQSTINAFGASLFRPIFLAGGDNPVQFYQENKEDYDSKARLYYDFIMNSESKLKSVVNGIYAKTIAKGSILKLLYGHDAHFTDNYEGKKIRIGEDDNHRRMHNLAKKKLRDRNVSVYNATVGGELEVFPRVDLNSIQGR